MNDALDVCAPFTVRKLNRLLAPWMTSQIREQWHARDRLFRIAQRQSCPIMLSQYRLARKHLKATIKQAKNSYILSQFEDQSSPAVIWSRLKRLGLAADK